MPRYARRPSGQRSLPGPWKNGPVPVVGLIGGIGAGKSRVASGLASRGAAVLDADTIGHALLDQRPARTEVVKRFGQDVLSPPESEGGDPRIDRNVLGRIVFAEPTARRALESILHPKMRATFEKAIRRVARRQEAPLVVLDAAVLLEAGWDDLCDVIVFVDAPEQVRRARLSESRGWSAADLAARQSAQWPLGRKREQADVILKNNGTAEDLEAQLGPLWKKLLRRPEFQPESFDRDALPLRDRPADRPDIRPRSGPPSGSASAPRPRSRGRRKP